MNFIEKAVAVVSRVRRATQGYKTHSHMGALAALAAAGFLAGDLTLIEAGLIAAGAGGFSSYKAGLERLRQEADG